MFGFGKVLLIALVLCTIGIDANRARRRRQAPLPNPANVPPGSGPNPQILNIPGQPPAGQHGQNNQLQGKQANRQYYSPYQGQYGYGSIQGINYPYGGAGLGSYQYGSGQYGQFGGSYYNQYPGSNSFYQGYGSSYNRPNYYGSNYYPSSGSYGGGGYFWNSSSKNHLNQYTLFLSLLFTLLVYVVTK